MWLLLWNKKNEKQLTEIQRSVLLLQLMKQNKKKTAYTLAEIAVTENHENHLCQSTLSVGGWRF